MGIAARTKIDSFGLVTTIIAIAPTNRKRLRNASDAEEPNVALSCVVSAERREAMRVSRPQARLRFAVGANLAHPERLAGDERQSQGGAQDLAAAFAE